MDLMQMLFGGTGSSTAPYGPQADALQGLYGQIPGLLSRGPMFSEAGVSGAEQSLQDIIGGDYLPGGARGNLFNENLQAQFRQAMPGVTSGFARAGRGGSGLATQALGQTFGDIYSGLYGQERQNQMQALGMAPSIYGARQNLAWGPYMNAAKIAGTGPTMQESSTETGGLLPGIANTVAGYYGMKKLF